MNKILEEINKIGIVPVIALNDAKDAKPLANALIKGGLPCAEVTFRTDAAEESIRIIAKEFPDMLLGAGTVLTIEQVDRAVNAGARFIVSPGFNPDVVNYCVSQNIPIVPGAINPSDVERAIACGLDVVKFFPAEAAGGLKMIKALCGPFTKMKFMPTGGINADNLKEYLDFKKILACGGTWMVKSDLIENGEFDKIEELTRQAVQNMLGFEVRHVGINANTADNATKIADSFENIFGFAKKESETNIFCGIGVEILKIPFRGDMGHIAVATNYIDRAIYHLERQGVKFDYSSLAKDDKGNNRLIYMEDQIGGFAVHLTQK